MLRLIILVTAIFTSLVCQAQFRDVKAGDILSINGVKGIVFNVNEDGTHGQIMSVKAFRASKDLFCTKSSSLKGLSMLSEKDGKQNTEELFSYCKVNNVPLTVFPVFNWCKSLGQGWYIPSILQLKDFINYWLGNKNVVIEWDEDEEETISDDSKPHTQLVNTILLEAGGIPFLNGVFSSTLDDKHKVDVFEYNKEDGKWKFKKTNPMKVDKFCTGRAFYDF